MLHSGGAIKTRGIQPKACNQLGRHFVSVAVLKKKGKTDAARNWLGSTHDIMAPSSQTNRGGKEPGVKSRGPTNNSKHHRKESHRRRQATSSQLFLPGLMWQEPPPPPKKSQIKEKESKRNGKPKEKKSLKADDREKKINPPKNSMKPTVSYMRCFHG